MTPSPTIRMSRPVAIEGWPTVALVADAMAAYLLDALDLDHTRRTSLVEHAALSNGAYTIDTK